MNERINAGLTSVEADNTNAPAGQMEEAPPPVLLPEETTAALCHDFQNVAFAHLCDRLKRALIYVREKECRVKDVVVVGGVAANLELRKRLLEVINDKDLLEINNNTSTSNAALNGNGNDNNNDDNTTSPPFRLVFPPPSLCTDNGVMSAWSGVEKLLLGISDAIEGQEVIARWPLGEPLQNVVFSKKVKSNTK